MDKDKLVLEYIDLCLKYMSLCKAATIEEPERFNVIQRIYEIREELGMEPICLRGGE